MSPRDSGSEPSTPGRVSPRRAPLSGAAPPFAQSKSLRGVPRRVSLNTPKVPQGQQNPRANVSESPKFKLLERTFLHLRVAMHSCGQKSWTPAFVQKNLYPGRLRACSPAKLYLRPEDLPRPKYDAFPNVQKFRSPNHECIQDLAPKGKVGLWWEGDFSKYGSAEGWP